MKKLKNDQLIKKIILGCFLTFGLNTQSFASSNRDLLDVLLKSALTSFTVLPFTFSASKLAVGGFANFSARSSGSYTRDIKDTKTGYGAFVAYELTGVEVEAFAKNLHFTTEIPFGDTYLTGESKSLVYGFGIRMPIWSIITFKAGYCLHDIKSKSPTYNADSQDVITERRIDDNGFFYGGGVRIPFRESFSLYADATGYYLKQLRIHLIDAELGLRYAF